MESSHTSATNYGGFMRVLLVGAGGVGEAIVSIATQNDPEAKWLDAMIVSDYNFDQASMVAAKTGDPRVTAEKIDANDKDQIIRNRL